MMKNKIIIFTDGASKGNPGPGGYGAIVALPEGLVREFGGREDKTTNNRMELSGAIMALASVVDRAEDISIYTDSKYLIGGMSEWIYNWQKNNWRTAQKKEVLNRDLWEKLASLSNQLKISKKERKIDWHYVSGHKGIAGNERCDEIASGLALGTSVILYDGPISEYGIDLSNLSQNE